MRNFRELKVWQKAHQLALTIYSATVHFPEHERFGLISQLRRASVSIPANIAEGLGMGTDAGMIRFLQIALGSAGELEYLLLLAKDLEYLKDSDYEFFHKEATDVGRMLTGFIGRLKLKPAASG
jgi:four helix bundle protein